MIQIPRLYSIYKGQNMINNFQEFLDNIFRPLFEVSVDPSADPNLHLFLQQMVGFDCVDDESKTEFIFRGDPIPPNEWDATQNPPYGYYCYYLYANIITLNKFRESRNLSTFSFRPHAGEAGSVNHLASAFLCADNISHGITLRKAPVLQYMYYLSQVGLSLSPLSNNKLFLDLNRSPFLSYFKIGMCVTLSTDDPLQFHYSVTPLTGKNAFV
jgi:AMP deaminase